MNTAALTTGPMSTVVLAILVLLIVAAVGASLSLPDGVPAIIVRGECIHAAHNRGAGSRTHSHCCG